MSNLPKGWEEVNFDNFFKTISAKKYQIQKKDYLQKSIYPVIDQGQKFIIAYSNQSEKVLKNSKGLIIFGDHTRIIKFIDFDFIVGADGTQILDTKNNIDIKFAYYALLFKEIVSLGYSRHFKIIKEFNYLVPPLEEQKKIADILSTVDKKIAFVEENINATEELKKGLMQKLLTEGIGHTEFKDSELGKIPKSWRIVNLEEVCSKIVGGGTPSKNESTYWENGTIPWVTPSEFTKSKSKFISTTENKITEDGLKNSSSILLEVGTVIMSSRATIGECKINTIEITTNQGFISFKCNDSLYNLYLLFLLIFNKNNILKISSGSTFLEVSRTSMKNFNIHFPPFEEQKQIAEILSTIDEKLEVLRDKKEHFEELKKGLMQKLLTGEIRV